MQREFFRASYLANHGTVERRDISKIINIY